jgi:rRNA-processing protein FCF1
MATPTATRSTLVAVDTNFLLDLATPKEKADDTVEIFRKRVPGVEFIVVPTVLDELNFIAESGDTAAHRKLARTTLEKLVLVWRFRPRDFIPVGHGIIDQIAQKLRGENLIPEVEMNDSYIVAEAALAGCTILITSDAHILDADPRLVGSVLKSCDVNLVLIRSPADIVRQFGGKR